MKMIWIENVSSYNNSKSINKIAIENAKPKFLNVKLVCNKGCKHSQIIFINSISNAK